MDVLKKYNLMKKVPNSILTVIKKGILGEIPENPKKTDACFRNVKNYLIGSVKNAISKVENYLKEEYFKVIYFSDEIKGEAREFGRDLYNIVLNQDNQHFLKGEKQNLALIGTGELTVTIRGDGIGGRNQEMLLSFLDFIKN